MQAFFERVLHSLAQMRVLWIALGVAILVCAPASKMRAASSDFVGTWLSIDQNTRDIAYIRVTNAPSGLSLQVFGACSPTPCDWGTVPAHLYARTVTEDAFQGAIVITGNYDHGFARIEVVLQVTGANRLRYETLTEFRDKSGRSDYYQAGQLARGSAAR